MADQSSRRVFLKKVAASTATGSGLLATDLVLAQTPAGDQKAKPEPRAKGYQETEHVRAYYRHVNF